MEPKPLITDGTKQPISEQTFNWSVFLAGIRAETAAKAAGGVDPRAAQALLDSGGVTVAGHTFPPVTAGFLLTLPMLQKVAAADEVLGSNSGQVMLFAWALAYPQSAWTATRQSLKSGDCEQLTEAVLAFAEGFKLPDLKQVSDWVENELNQLREEPEEAETAPGKSEPTGA